MIKIASVTQPTQEGCDIIENEPGWENDFFLSEEKTIEKKCEFYKGDKIKVLIINHYSFKNCVIFETDERKGSEVDIEDLKKIFEPSRYNVTVHNDKDRKDLLTKDKVFEEVNKVVEEMNGFQQLIVIISSHGDIKSINAYDDKYEINTFLNKLNHKNLEGKPKFIILNACRPEGSDNKTKNIKKTEDHYFRELNINDCLLVQSAYPGENSFKDPDAGARLLRSFRTALHKLKTTKEKRLVLDLFVDIKRHVATAHKKDSQIPVITHNLTKHLYITMSKLENVDSPEKNNFKK